MSTASGTIAPLAPVAEVSEEEKEFLAEVEVMDLSPIKDKTFMVAVGTGGPDTIKFLCSTPHGPYNFTEMCQEVGDMWIQHQHHAKAIILEKDPKAKVYQLDGNTIDYIECHFQDIIMEEFLAGVEEPKEFTCTAGTVTEPEPEEKK